MKGKHQQVNVRNMIQDTEKFNKHGIIYITDT